MSMLSPGGEGEPASRYSSKKWIVIQQYYSFALFYLAGHFLSAVDQGRAIANGGA
jgi:hypothetical protein